MDQVHELAFFFFTFQSSEVVHWISGQLLEHASSLHVFRLRVRVDVVFLKDVLASLAEVLVQLHQLWNQFLLKLLAREVSPRVILDELLQRVLPVDYRIPLFLALLLLLDYVWQIEPGYTLLLFFVLLYDFLKLVKVHFCPLLHVFDDLTRPLVSVKNRHWAAKYIIRNVVHVLFQFSFVSQLLRFHLLFPLCSSNLLQDDECSIDAFHAAPMVHLGQHALVHVFLTAGQILVHLGHLLIFSLKVLVA